MGLDKVPINPRYPERGMREVWRLRVTSPGDYHGERVTMDRDNVPAEIAVDKRYEFEIREIGSNKKKSLIAFGAREIAIANNAAEKR